MPTSSLGLKIRHGILFTILYSYGNMGAEVLIISFDMIFVCDQIDIPIFNLIIYIYRCF